MDDSIKPLIRKKGADLATKKTKVSPAFTKVFNHTVESLDEVVSNRFYPDIMTSLKQGKASMELRKRFMLRAVDETWVTAVEDVLPILDELIRNPRRFIEEEEMILPIEQTKSITPRSIRHLSQHVNNIADIDGDEVIPSKLLNVFREESVLTYENKFLNTLINRLYVFVARRYEQAKLHPLDSKTTKLTYDQDFSHGEIHGKIHYTMELEEPADESEVERSYTYSYDVWRRVEKIYAVCLSNLTSTFCKSMKGFTVRSPIIHTNAIMKDKNLRQCLALWEFIESYENSGYTLLVDEHVEDIDMDYIVRFYESMSVEYLMFREKLHGGFDESKTLDKSLDLSFFEPRIVDDLEPTPKDEFDAHYGLRLPENIKEREMTELEHRVLAAIEQTLDAVERAEEAEEALKKAIIRRSFLSRIIQGSEALQTYYTEVKNLLLSYKGVRSRISWYGETFHFGRDRYAYLTVKGKRLVVFLHLNPEDYNEEQYHHRDAASRGAKYEKTRLELRVASQRALKYCGFFVSEMFKDVTEKLDPFEKVDYRMPYESDEELLAKGLIKIVGETVEKMPEIPDQTPEIPEDAVAVNLPPEKVEVEVEVPKPTPMPEGPAPVEEVKVDESLIIRSFLSRLIQGGEEMQDYYSQIKNALMSYKDMRSYVAWAGETFVKGRVREAYMAVKGKHLVLFLNLDPSAYPESSYHQKDATRRGKKFEKTPLELRVSSARALKYALFFIAEMMKDEPLDENFKPETYAWPNESDKALWRRELIKVKGDVPPEWLEDDKAPVPAAETPAPEVPAEEPEKTAEPESEPASEESETEVAVDESLILRSFQSRLIQGGEEMQDYYSQITNALLSYQDMRSYIAWAGETFVKGRVREAYMAVKGKHLVLFLNLDPSAYPESSYHQKDATRRGKKFEKTPLELRVSSARALKYALFFIAEMMKDEPHDESFKPETYAWPHESDKALWRRELIKVKGDVPPEWLEDEPAPAVLEPVVEPEEPEEPAEEPIPVPEEKTEETVIVRSFVSRLTQGSPDMQAYYGILKNTLLSYKGVRCCTAWAGETFLKGREREAYMAIKGKNLVLFLNLDPSAYPEASYHQKDATRRGKKFEKTPFELRVSSPRAFKYALFFVEETMKPFEKDESYKPLRIAFRYEDDKALWRRELIKVKGPIPADWLVEEPKEEAPTVILRSFTARLSQATEDLAFFYNELKNLLLSYKGVRCCTAWAGETFLLGREREAYMAVKGKNLVLFLNLDPKAYPEASFHQKDATRRGKKFEKTPFELRVSSPRAFKYALSFIQDVMKDKTPVIPGFERGEYRPAYATDGELLAAGLIRIKGTPVTFAPVEFDDDVIFDGVDNTKNSEERYSRSLTSKLIQADEVLSQNYEVLKNLLLSYKGVKDRMSFSHETFNRGMLKLCMIKVRGKNLCLLLALDPSTLAKEKYHHHDLRKDGKTVPLPTLLKVRSARSLKYAAELIDALMTQNGLPRTDRAPESYFYPYEDDSALLAKGLIKVRTVTLAVDTPDAPKPVARQNGHFSLKASLTLASEEEKALYAAVKNRLLSGKYVRASMGRYYETFTLGRKILARISYKQGELLLFLAVEPSETLHKQVAFRTFRELPFLAETETAIPVTAKTLDGALKVISEILFSLHFVTVDETYEAQDFAFPEKTERELRDEGEILLHEEKPESVKTPVKSESKPAARRPLTLEDILAAAENEPESEEDDEAEDEDEDDED